MSNAELVPLLISLLSLTTVLSIIGVPSFVVLLWLMHTNRIGVHRVWDPWPMRRRRSAAKDLRDLGRVTSEGGV